MVTFIAMYAFCILTVKKTELKGVLHWCKPASHSDQRYKSSWSIGTSTKFSSSFTTLSSKLLSTNNNIISMNFSFVFFFFVFFSTLVFGSIVDVAKHALINTVNSYGGPVAIGTLVFYCLATENGRLIYALKRDNSSNIYHRSEGFTGERLVPSPACPLTPTEILPAPEGDTPFRLPPIFFIAALVFSTATGVSLTMALYSFRLAQLANGRSNKTGDVENKLQTRILKLETLLNTQVNINEKVSKQFEVVTGELTVQNLANKKFQLMFERTRRMLATSINKSLGQNEPRVNQLREAADE